MQGTEIGHFSLEINNKQFNLVPSLRNMARLASANRLIRMYEIIHNPTIPGWFRVNLAGEILRCCSNSAEITKHLIKVEQSTELAKVLEQQEDKSLLGWLSSKVFKPSEQQESDKISANDQVVVAAALMRHGIAGVNRPEFEGSKGGKKAADSFDVNKVIADAMIHFKLSKSEAESLTMSEFCYLLAAKYPPTKQHSAAPSLDDHKAAMKALMEAK